MEKQLTNCQKRCQDCAYLKIKNGMWVCDECFGQKIEEIDDCPNGIILEEIEKIDKKAKENGVKNIARSETPTKRKPRERKPDEEKEKLISEVATFLESVAENVTITNISKIVEFDLGGSHYKIDLIRQRCKK